MNFAPLLAITLGLQPPADGLPSEWSDALVDSGLSEGALVDYVVSDPTLSSMIRQPVNPEAFSYGQIGLLGHPDLFGDWEAANDLDRLLPQREWWPEAIQLGDGIRLAYPADRQPDPVLAFFVPIARPEFGAIDLARVFFPLLGIFQRQGNRPPPLIDWPSPDGRCAHQISYETGFRVVTCRTQNCPRECHRRPVPRDGGRLAVFCECE